MDAGLRNVSCIEKHVTRKKVSLVAVAAPPCPSSPASNPCTYAGHAHVKGNLATAFVTCYVSLPTTGAGFTQLPS